MLHPVFTQRFRPSCRTQHLTPKGGEAPRAARCTVARHHFPYFLWRHDLLTSKNSVTPWALCQLRHSTALCCLYEPPTPTLHLSVSSVNVGPRHPRFQPACAESVYQCHCPLHEGLLFHARRKNSFRCCYHRPIPAHHCVSDTEGRNSVNTARAELHHHVPAFCPLRAHSLTLFSQSQLLPSQLVACHQCGSRSLLSLTVDPTSRHHPCSHAVPDDSPPLLVPPCASLHTCGPLATFLVAARAAATILPVTTPPRHSPSPWCGSPGHTKTASYRRATAPLWLLLYTSTRHRQTAPPTRPLFRCAFRATRYNTATAVPA